MTRGIDSIAEHTFRARQCKRGNLAAQRLFGTIHFLINFCSRSFLQTLAFIARIVLGFFDHLIGSTSSLLNHVRTAEHDEFIVATEAGILHQMQKARPSATLIPAPPSTGCNCSLCPYMRLNTMEKVYLCMRDKQPEIIVPEAIRARALLPVERMLELG